MCGLFSVLQLCGSGTGRTHTVACHPHQQGGDQCRAPHQPQRDQKTEREGKGTHFVICQWPTSGLGEQLTFSLTLHQSLNLNDQTAGAQSIDSFVYM